LKIWGTICISLPHSTFWGLVDPAVRPVVDARVHGPSPVDTAREYGPQTRVSKMTPCWIPVFTTRHHHSVYRPLSCIVIRPHRRTTYVDAAYSYRPSSVVCLSVWHTSEPCKNGCTDRAAVGLRTWVGPGNHVLDGGPDPPMGRGNFFFGGGEWASHCKV